MKIFVANFSFGGYRDAFVECFPTAQARTDAIEEVRIVEGFGTPAYEWMEVELHDVEVKPTKKDVIRFFNNFAQHEQ